MATESGLSEERNNLTWGSRWISGAGIYRHGLGADPSGGSRPGVAAARPRGYLSTTRRPNPCDRGDAQILVGEIRNMGIDVVGVSRVDRIGGAARLRIRLARDDS